MIKKSFTTKLQKDPAKGGWTYIITPFDGRKVFKTKGYVKADVTIDGYSFSATLMPVGDGTYFLGVKEEIRKAIGKEAGDRVRVTLAVKNSQ
jgi:hypothetical protein